MDISIILPVFNSETFIESSIKTLLNYLYNIKELKDIQIVLVNDGSKDNTLEKLKEITQKTSSPKTSFEIISYKKNQGIGFAIKQGLTKVKNNLIIIMDCDLPFNLDIIEQSLRLLEKNDLIIVDRTQKKESYPVGVFRKILHKGLIKIIQITFPELSGINDFVAGFKAIKKELITKINPFLNSNTSLIHLEIILYTVILQKYYNEQYSIEKVLPIINQESIEKSTYSIKQIIKTIIAILKEILILRIKVSKLINKSSKSKEILNE